MVKSLEAKDGEEHLKKLSDLSLEQKRLREESKSSNTAKAIILFSRASEGKIRTNR